MSLDPALVEAVKAALKAEIQAEVQASVEADFQRMDEYYQRREVDAVNEFGDREAEYKRRIEKLEADLRNITVREPIILQEPAQDTFMEDAEARVQDTPPPRRSSRKPQGQVAGTQSSSPAAPRTPQRPRPSRQAAAPSSPTQTKSKPSRSKPANPSSPVLANVGIKPAAERLQPAEPKDPLQYQLRVKSLSKDEHTILACFMTHIRVMAGWPEAWSVPSDPNPQVLARFNEQFTGDAQIARHLASGQPLIKVSSVNVYPYKPSSTRQLTRTRMGQIEEHIVEYIRTMLARVGLPAWAPNFAETPYSLYNTAARLIAVETFKQALVSRAYDFMSANTKYAKDMELLFKIYDHIVHFHFHRIYAKDQRDPGSVEDAAKLNPVYVARARLCKSRLAFLKDQGFPHRYRRYITVKSTSDDEQDPTGRKINGRPVFLIRQRPERSAQANAFVRALENTMERAKDVTAKRRRRDKIRIVPSAIQPTLLPAAPTGLPIDYFDPAYLNILPPRLRLDVARKVVGLLPDASQSFTLSKDEKLSDHDFNAKFLKSVMERYNWPTADDFAGASDAASEADSNELEEWDSEEEDEDENEEDDEGKGDELGALIDEDEDMESVLDEQEQRDAVDRKSVV